MDIIFESKRQESIARCRDTVNSTDAKVAKILAANSIRRDSTLALLKAGAVTEAVADATIVSIDNIEKLALLVKKQMHDAFQRMHYVDE